MAAGISVLIELISAMLDSLRGSWVYSCGIISSLGNLLLQGPAVVNCLTNHRSYYYSLCYRHVFFIFGRIANPFTRRNVG